MAKPVVIEVNNKCTCFWNAGSTVTLTNQHPEGNIPWMSHAFSCKVLDDRGLYLYVDTRPNGYRFWCTQCKNPDPMSFTYFSEQQTEFVASVMRRFGLVEDTKKKLDKRIQELTDTLSEERERFENEMTQEKTTAEETLSNALEESQTRDIYFRAKEEEWTKADTERKEYERKKKAGLSLVRAIGRFDFDDCSRDGIGEIARDFIRAGEEMTKLVDPLLNVQGFINACIAQEKRLADGNNPRPTLEAKTAFLLRTLINVLGTESSSNAVPLMVVGADGQQTAVHVPFEMLAQNGATQNIRRLPKSNYKLCPNHDPCAHEPNCTFFHLKCINMKFPRAGEVAMPGAFVRDRSDLQSITNNRGAAVEGCLDSACHCKTRIHLHAACAPLVHVTWYERDEIWKFIVSTTESDDMNENLDRLKKMKVFFERFLGRHPKVLSSSSTSENDNSKNKFKRGTLHQEEDEHVVHAAAAAAAASSSNNNNNNNNNEGNGNDDDNDEEDDDDLPADEDAAYFPDGSISALEEAVINLFAKARATMFSEYQRIREMTHLLSTFDFHFLQLKDYSGQMHQFRVPRDLDALIKNITDTSLRCGELIRLPKPTLEREGKGFAVGVALVVRQTENTFEDLQHLRDRVDTYKEYIDQSKQAHKVETEIEGVERQIDHKQKEIVRARRKIELIDADLEVLIVDGESEIEIQEKRSEKTKVVAELQAKQRELTELQKEHHDRFVFLVETRDKILPDLDLRDSEHKRWTELLGEGNESALPQSKNLVDFVKNKRSAAMSSP